MAKKKDFFWASYADLMTSLFFIMLVLFVLAVAMHQSIKKKLEKEKDLAKAKLEEFQKIEEIKKSINTINKDFFEYSTIYKKHIFKVKVEYKKGGADIEKDLKDKSVIPKLEQAGKDIVRKIKKVITENPDIQYLVIIEGQASADGYYKNDELSYLRALNLKKFWKKKNIDFDGFTNCELVVAGSGEGGVPRVKGNERKNQRFLIHIIPKTGIID